jgi:uncharacterized protein YcbK (DUF882 family)
MPIFCKDHQAVVDHGRRRLLRGALGCTAALLSAPALAVPSRDKERVLSFYNTHTGESLRTVYRASGKYVPEALKDVNRILRDHYTNQTSPIDPELLDMLYSLRQRLGSREAFHIISGYRSPKTNAQKAAKSKGVAKKSLHLEGKAIDVRLPGVELVQLRKAAVALAQGGVGYYPGSNFVHLDTGKVRSW